MPVIFNPYPELSERDTNRFWGKVNIQARQDVCWNWKGRVVADGYGHFDWSQGRKNKRSLIAHRVAWIIMKGAIAEGKILQHSCDNPKCCNINHLSEGTQKSNSEDRDAKGRNINHVGSKHGCAKLNEADVIEIRRLHSVGESIRSIARKYTLDHTHTSRIVRKKLWKHI